MSTVVKQDFKYVELAVDGVNNRNRLTTLNNLNKYIYHVDTFRSMFLFNQELVEYVKKNKSVAHFDGICYIDNIIFDIDSDDLEKAQQYAIRLIEKLAFYDVNPTNLGIYFSGNKGFHIAMPADWLNLEPSDNLPNIVGEVAKELAGDVPIDNIYNKLRLIRLTGTKHSESNLYKTPLSYDELIKHDVEKIKKLAKFYRKDNPPAGGFVLQPLEELYNEIKNKPQQSQTKIDDLGLKNNKPVKLCYAKMLQGVSSGLRNNAAIRIASYFAKYGVPADIVFKLTKEWNSKNSPPLPEEELKVIVESALRNKYDFGCNDEFLQKFCTDECYLYTKVKDKKDEHLINASALIGNYIEYISEREKSNIKLGIDGLDDVLNSISLSDCMYIVARPSIGKTALAVHIAIQLAKQNFKTHFISLEMPRERIFERMACSLVGVNPKLLKVELDYPEIQEKIRTILSNIKINNTPKFTTTDLDYILTKDPAQVMIIDYLGLVHSKVDGAYERVSRIARELQIIAKKHKVFMIILSQASRRAGDGTRPLTLDMIRDSGVVEEAADYVLTMWKPDLFQNIIYLDLVKNRHGASGVRIEGILDGNTMSWIFSKIEKGRK